MDTRTSVLEVELVVGSEGWEAAEVALVPYGP